MSFVYRRPKPPKRELPPCGGFELDPVYRFLGKCKHCKKSRGQHHEQPISSAELEKRNALPSYLAIAKENPVFSGNMALQSSASSLSLLGRRSRRLAGSLTQRTMVQLFRDNEASKENNRQESNRWSARSYVSYTSTAESSEDEPENGIEELLDMPLETDDDEGIKESDEAELPVSPQLLEVTPIIPQLEPVQLPQKEAIEHGIASANEKPVLNKSHPKVPETTNPLHEETEDGAQDEAEGDKKTRWSLESMKRRISIPSIPKVHRNNSSRFLESKVNSGDAYASFLAGIATAGPDTVDEVEFDESEDKISTETDSSEAKESNPVEQNEEDSQNKVSKYHFLSLQNQTSPGSSRRKPGRARPSSFSGLRSRSYSDGMSANSRRRSSLPARRRHSTEHQQRHLTLPRSDRKGERRSSRQSTDSYSGAAVSASQSEHRRPSSLQSSRVSSRTRKSSTGSKDSTRRSSSNMGNSRNTSPRRSSVQSYQSRRSSRRRSSNQSVTSSDRRFSAQSDESRRTSKHRSSAGSDSASQTSIRRSSVQSGNSRRRSGRRRSSNGSAASTSLLHSPSTNILGIRKSQMDDEQFLNEIERLINTPVEGTGNTGDVSDGDESEEDQLPEHSPLNESSYTGSGPPASAYGGTLGNISKNRFEPSSPLHSPDVSDAEYESSLDDSDSSFGFSEESSDDESDGSDEESASSSDSEWSFSSSGENESEAEDPSRGLREVDAALATTVAELDGDRRGSSDPESILVTKQGETTDKTSATNEESSKNRFEQQDDDDSPLVDEGLMGASQNDDDNDSMAEVEQMEPQFGEIDSDSDDSMTSQPTAANQFDFESSDDDSEKGDIPEPDAQQLENQWSQFLFGDEEDEEDDPLVPAWFYGEEAADGGGEALLPDGKQFKRGAVVKAPVENDGEMHLVTLYRHHPSTGTATVMRYCGTLMPDVPLAKIQWDVAEAEKRAFLQQTLPSAVLHPPPDSRAVFGGMNRGPGVLLESDQEARSIWLACRSGDLGAVRYLVQEEHAHFDRPEEMEKGMEGRTPLYWACLCRHAHIVRYLLELGARDADGSAYICTSREIQGLLARYGHDKNGLIKPESASVRKPSALRRMVRRISSRDNRPVPITVGQALLPEGAVLRRVDSDEDGEVKFVTSEGCPHMSRRPSASSSEDSHSSLHSQDTTTSTSTSSSKPFRKHFQSDHSSDDETGTRKKSILKMYGTSKKKKSWLSRSRTSKEVRISAKARVRYFEESESLTMRSSRSILESDSGAIDKIDEETGEETPPPYEEEEVDVQYESEEEYEESDEDGANRRPLSQRIGTLIRRNRVLSRNRKGKKYRPHRVRRLLLNNSSFDSQSDWL